MADEILIKYVVDVNGLKVAQKEVATTTEMVTEMQTEVKAAFSGKAIDDANQKLEKFNGNISKTTEEFTSAKQELQQLTKQLTSGQLEGQALLKAKQRAAELTDKIGDAREEIRRMASDTRFLDTVVEGIRGVAAGFSVAQGAAALFGDENEDLQKTLIKVQGAMALLQGAQELANIATREGGIASRAYGVALQAVEKISKVTGLSIAASWAAATAGIGLVLGAIAYFVTSMDDAQEEAGQLNEELRDQQYELAGLQIEYQALIGEIDAYTASLKQLKLEQGKAVDDVQKEIETKALKARPAWWKIILGSLDPARAARFQAEAVADAYVKGTAEAQPKIDAINERIRIKNEMLHQRELNRLADMEADANNKRAQNIEEQNSKNREAYERNLKDRMEALEKRIRAEEDFYNHTIDIVRKGEDDILKEVNKKLKEGIDNKPAEVPITLTFKPFKEDQIKAEVENAVGAMVSVLEKLKPTIDAFGQLFGALSDAEQQKVDEARERNLLALEEDTKKQLLLAGDNEKQKTAILEQAAKRRQKIEQDAAIAKAKLERQQAIADKAFALFDILLNTSKAVMKFTAGLPGTAPLLALAIATGALEAAAVAARPLPAIPKFAKGGAVPLFGGGIERGMITGAPHHSGGVLINAEGGEFINNKASTAKYYDVLEAANEHRLEGLIFSKYIVPALQAVKNKQSESDAYDDGLLRNEVRRNRQSESLNTRKIIAAIESNKFNPRYGGFN